MRILKRVQLQIHIKVWPIEVSSMRCFDIVYGSNSGVFEPRVISEREKIFLISNDQPDAILRNVLNFSVRSAFSKREGFHCAAPLQRLEVALKHVPEAHENAPRKQWARAKTSRGHRGMRYEHAHDSPHARKRRTDSAMTKDGWAHNSSILTVYSFTSSWAASPKSS